MIILERSEKMIEAVKEFFTHYADFKGRTSRKNFWLAFLGIMIISGILGFIVGLVVGSAGVDVDKASSAVSLLITLVIIIPTISMCVRRLHDINKSGLWYLVSFLPFVGSIILLIFYLKPSVDEGNNY
jgi:uncharacterized membrane protein YhaH (DUF805 family)